MKASIVIPLFNESDVVQKLFERLENTTSSLREIEWNLILVNDGCTDDTVEQIKKHRCLFKGPIKVISFSRNFGHQRALLAGLSDATGDVVIELDADLQDPPEMIPQFIQKYKEGYDVVYGIRQTRDGCWSKKLTYALFYRIFQRIAETPIPLDAGDFGLMSMRVVKTITHTPERDMFLRGFRGWMGFKQIGLPYSRPCRLAGETKYSFRKLLSLAASAFFGYSFLPLRIATALGFGTVLLAFIFAAYSLYSKFDKPDTPVGWTSTICIISLLSGAQLITTGILGEYIGRIYRQTQARPPYIIAEQLEL